MEKISEIFSLRPCNVSVSYMGFPGSHGSSYLTHQIVDKIVVPKHLRGQYMGNLVYMGGR